MSRFNTPKAVTKTAREMAPSRVPDASAPSVPIALQDGESRPASITRSLILAPASPDISVMQQVGFGLLCIFPMSAFANEFAMRAFHFKAYISTVSWVLLPLLLILSGNLLRGMRDVSGRVWLLFLAWVMLATPFSVWKGGSVTLLLSYVPHGWILLYYCAAFLISFRHCRRYLFFLIASNVMLLLDCFLFGTVTGGRFDIPDSLFFTNANDLALQLLIAVTQFMYLLYQRQVWKNVLGAVGMLGALLYMLKTGSRGAFLAAGVLAVVCIIFGKNRMPLLLASIPVVLGLLILAPTEAFHRLTLVELQPQVMSARDMSDASAIASQKQRMELFKQSVRLAITHPLLGVGPGEFAVAASGEAVKEGTRPTWLGTHNSYTEVASECGIPAFLMYVSVLGVALISTFRIFRRAADLVEYRDLSAVAFCIFCSTLVFAICAFFFHIAYSGYLPQLAGMGIALRLGTDPALWSKRFR